MTFKIGTTLAVLYGLMPMVPTAAHADYVYQYVGSTFNYGMSQGITYTPVTENLVATLDSTSALAANSTYTFGTGSSTFVSWGIGLGTETCTFQCLGGGSITTNSSGTVSSWSLSILGASSIIPTITGSNTAAKYDTGSDSSTGPQSFTSVPLYDAKVVNNGLAGPDYVEGSTTPGTWSIDAPPVPLPASAYLLLSGLVGIGVAARNRRWS